MPPRAQNDTASNPPWSASGPSRPWPEPIAYTQRGFTAQMSSVRSRSFSRADGRKLVTNTSAHAISPSSAARPSSLRRSIATLRLLRLNCSKRKLKPSTSGTTPNFA